MRFAVLLLTAILLCAAPQKSKQPKPVEVELAEIKCVRDGETILLDGRIVAQREKPIANLRLIFRFMAPGSQVVSTRNGEVEPELLSKGEEAEFHMQLTAPARVVEFDVAGEDRDGRELRFDRSGPFPIE